MKVKFESVGSWGCNPKGVLVTAETLVDLKEAAKLLVKEDHKVGYGFEIAVELLQKAYNEAFK